MRQPDLAAMRFARPSRATDVSAMPVVNGVLHTGQVFAVVGSPLSCEQFTQRLLAAMRGEAHVPRVLPSSAIELPSGSRLEIAKRLQVLCKDRLRPVIIVRDLATVPVANRPTDREKLADRIGWLRTQALEHEVAVIAIAGSDFFARVRAIADVTALARDGGTAEAFDRLAWLATL